MDEMDETDEIQVLKKNAELTEDIRITTDRNTTGKIQAVCNNCNKRFKSMHSVTMHLKNTTTPHVVIFINRGNYDKKTGLKSKTDRIMK
jgi:hypothetical protein